MDRLPVPARSPADESPAFLLLLKPAEPLPHDLASLDKKMYDVDAQCAATSMKLDSSSLGIFMLQLLSGGVMSAVNSHLDWGDQEHWPWAGLQHGTHEFVQLQMQYAAELTEFYPGLSPCSPELAGLEPEAVELILGLLHPDPKQRCPACQGMQDVLASPWLAPAVEELRCRLAACQQQFNAQQDAMQALALAVYGPEGTTCSRTDSVDWYWEPENIRQMKGELQQTQQQGTCVSAAVFTAAGSTGTTSAINFTSSSTSASSVLARLSGSAEPCTSCASGISSQLSAITSSSGRGSGRQSSDAFSAGGSSCSNLGAAPAQLQHSTAGVASSSLGPRQHTAHDQPFEEVFCCARGWWEGMTSRQTCSNSNVGSSPSLRVPSAYRPDMQQLFQMETVSGAGSEG